MSICPKCRHKFSDEPQFFETDVVGGHLVVYESKKDRMGSKRLFYARVKFKGKEPHKPTPICEINELIQLMRNNELIDESKAKMIMDWAASLV